MINNDSSFTKKETDTFNLDDELLSLHCPIEPLSNVRDRSTNASWIVKDLFAEHEIALVAGARGAMKTYFAWGLGVCVAIGEPFLDLDTTQRHFLLIDQENPEGVIKERAEQLGSPEMLHIWARNLKDHSHKPPPKIDTDKGLAIYLRLIDRYGGNPVFVFDTLSKMHTRDENSNNDMKHVMANFRRLTNAGATVILLHHCSLTLEGGRPIKSRGASCIEDDADSVYLINKKKDRGKIELICPKNRLVYVPVLNLKLTYSYGQFSWFNAGLADEQE